jgi:proteasome lid subunit RPN8/RPN11
VPQKISKQLGTALEKAGDNEIGGVLMGEHVVDNTFRIVEVSIQSRKGTHLYFVRQLREAIFYLKSFFERTHHNYRRFNYLGEWHSHPKYTLCPSLKDKQTMWDIVHDRQVGANFAVLVIVHLANGAIQGAAEVYLPNYVSMKAELSFEMN